MNYGQNKLKLIFLLLIVFSIFALSSCGNGSNAYDAPGPDTGALHFSVVFHGAADLLLQAAVIDCAGYGIATVEADVYDTGNAFLVGGGPWNCETGRGTITSAPTGSDRTVVVLGKHADGHVAFRGQKTGIEVVAGQNNDAGTIDCHAFIPSLRVPADGALINADTMGLAWNAVAGATQYRILISEDGDFTDPLINAIIITTNYTPLGLSDTKTYYWQVIAVDAYDNTGVGSQIRSFTIDAAHDNSSPVAQITSPAQGNTYTAGDTITFTGSGNDNEDGDLSGASLVWRSDVDGQLGTGETLTSATLSVGTHHITLSAIDSEGATGRASVVITVATGRVPDTGQVQIENYEPVPGEDMTYTINPPSYTKLDLEGNALDNNTSEWAMVKDNVTGLTWEKKTTDENFIHNRDNTYSWQDMQEQFIDKLNKADFGGYSDWRLPTIKELYTILHNIKVDDNPKIDMAYFPNTMPSGYLSTTTYAENPSFAWGVHFNYSFVDDFDKSANYYVRAVRGRQNNSNLIYNGDNTVTDTASGLMWQQVEVNAELMNWEDALGYCEKLELSGYDDWRLPNAKELQSIIDYEKSTQPSIDEEFFPNTQLSAYWSSTTKSSYTDYAWILYFDNGLVIASAKSNIYYVRAVRGGQ